MIMVAEAGDRVEYAMGIYRILKVEWMDKPGSEGVKAWFYHLEGWDDPVWAKECQIVTENDPDVPYYPLPRMFEWKTSLPDRVDNSSLFPIVDLLLAVQYDKEGHYGSSWKGKGEYRGIVSNLDRKYDRVDNITQAEISGRMLSLQQIEEKLAKGEDVEVGESKVDAVADLANYSLLYLSWIRENYPLIFSKWVDRNVPAYLRENIQSV